MWRCYLSLRLTVTPVKCRPVNCRRLTVARLSVARWSVTKPWMLIWLAPFYATRHFVSNVLFCFECSRPLHRFNPCGSTLAACIVHLHHYKTNRSWWRCSYWSSSEMRWLCGTASGGSSEALKDSNDWVFQNYTYKRFQGLTQRGGLPFRTN